MAKQYQWRAIVDYDGDADKLTHGTTPNAQESWQTKDIGGSESGTYTYWYHDSNTSYQGSYQDAISSRVATPITQSWTTSVDSRNYLTVRITTVIEEVKRDNITGGDKNTPGRNITVYNSSGAAIASTLDDLVATEHQIFGRMDLGTETFVLAPGDASVVKSSVVIYNQTDGLPSWDRIGVGIQFRNILPAEWPATIKYSTNGSSIADTVVTDVYDPKNVPVTSAVPTRKHFVFLGWSRTSGGSATLHAGDTVSISSNNPTITLYAVWEYTYRPGQIRVNGVWKSHDRDSNLQDGRYMTMLGRCHILRGGTWVEMRTRANKEGLSYSPVIRRNGKWVSMALIGDEGQAHDVGY